MFGSCAKTKTKTKPRTKILTRAGYTCTAFGCTTPVHLYYTCFTPPNSYQFFGLGRKYHLLFYLVRQFPCLRLKITTWWYNIEVLDYIFSSLWSIFTIVVTTNTRKKACWSLCGKSISVALTGGVLCIITYLLPLLYFKCFGTHY